MFTSNIVFTSNGGGAPLVSRAGPTVLERAIPDQSPEAAAALRHVQPPALDLELSTILDQLFETAPGTGRTMSVRALSEYRAHGTDPVTRQMAENARAAALTKDALVAEMARGDWLDRPGRSEQPRNAEMVVAIRAGKASVLDLEDIGIGSKGHYTTHFTADGVHAGGTAEVEADFERIARFQDENIVRHADGRLTDRATGRNANFVQDGHKFLYVTWP